MIKTIIKALVAALILAGTGSCKKEGSLNTDALYTYTAPGTDAYNITSGSIVLLRNAIIADGKLSFPVLLTRAVEKDVQVTAVIDTGLLQLYDSVYKTTTPRYPAGKFKLSGNGSVTINAGQTSSADSLKVEITDTVGLDLAKIYVIPVKLNTSSAGVPVSNTRQIMYVKATLVKVVSSIPAAGSNIIDITVVKTPDGTIKAPTGTGFGAVLNLKLGLPVTVSVVYDAALITAFNNANKTSCIAFPAGSYNLAKDNVIIPAGSTSSGTDSIKIQLLNPGAFTEGNSYLLPLKIKDEGIVTAGAGNTVYIRLKVELNNIDPSNNGLTGTTINRTGWSIKASGQYSNYGPANILDGNNNTAWDSDGRLPAWLQLDMGTSQAVKGFQIVPSYLYRGDDFINMEVYSSNDGSTWVSQGKYAGTATSSSSSAANPDLKTVKFITPVTARYFKFNITKTTDGSYAGMAELNGVQ